MFKVSKVHYMANGCPHGTSVLSGVKNQVYEALFTEALTSIVLVAFVRFS